MDRNEIRNPESRYKRTMRRRHDRDRRTRKLGQDEKIEGVDRL